MTPVNECTIAAGGCIDTEARKPGPRALTLISKEAWSDACDELGADLPWYTRRANVLIEGVDLRASLGKKLRLGPVRLLVHGETKPCKLMDEQHQGLREVLKPDFRGGVFGEVLEGGTIRVGDAVALD